MYKAGYIVCNDNPTCAVYTNINTCLQVSGTEL